MFVSVFVCVVKAALAKTAVYVVFPIASHVAAVVTEAGIALNPKHKNYAELKEDLEQTSLKLVTIEELQALAEKLTGTPKPIETTDRVACIVEYRDGTVIDVIREVRR